VFTYPDVMFKRALDVSVGWDTGNPGVKGRVFRSLDGGNEVPLLGPDLASGTHIEKILLSQTLTFVLRKAIDRQELARSTVTTKKNALAEYMTDPNLGFIFHLKVVPTRRHSRDFVRDDTTGPASHRDSPPRQW
jgi:hypothetical protein